jgi:predicted ATP-dependent endonuclease of OLD family
MTPTDVGLSRLTFVFGLNGAGKTAVLVALARLLRPVPSMRRVQVSDLLVPVGSDPVQVDDELWWGPTSSSRRPLTTMATTRRSRRSLPT